jgi:hypothetical protein
MKQKKSRKLLIINAAFILLCGGILIFLLNAPDETTAFLPHDDIHGKFHEIKSKKAAGKFCVECHDLGKEAPLPDGHPPKFRCLFCHKRQ